ncbi:MAG: twin-arginine translocase TatA/TatE family subunit [Tabrizicola sp.]|nr:twin-arginine translocase TatA/TatE family subunit [Tabrizicola sp.]HMS95180.1 twin-arginine translocase TatA/TatE family subunit [Tabrizicola sp.]
MDLSWSELLVVGIVALIIIGPKDLPGMFRELGRFTAKIRAMGREFSKAMEAAAKESGVKDVADDLRKATSPKAMGLDAVKSAADKFEKWDPLKNAAKPTTPLTASTLTPPPMPATPAAAPVSEAAVGAGAVVVPAVGPNTAALYEKQAAKKAVLAETAAKLKAISEGEGPPAAAAAKAAETLPAKAPGRRRKKAEDKTGEAE